MKIKPLIVIICLITIFIIGCQQQVNYVCPDGTVVVQASLCPKQETPKTTEVKSIELTEEDIAFFNAQWVSGNDEWRCSTDYCNNVDCTQPTTLFSVNARINIASVCRFLVDGDSYEENWGTSSLLSDGMRLFTHMQSRSNPEKPSYWDDHELTMCCYADEDVNKKEVCITKTVQKLC